MPQVDAIGINRVVIAGQIHTTCRIHTYIYICTRLEYDTKNGHIYVHSFVIQFAVVVYYYCCCRDLGLLVL